MVPLLYSCVLVCFDCALKWTTLGGLTSVVDGGAGGKLLSMLLSVLGDADGVALIKETYEDETEGWRRGGVEEGKTHVTRRACWRPTCPRLGTRCILGPVGSLFVFPSLWQALQRDRSSPCNCFAVGPFASRKFAFCGGTHLLSSR